MTFRECGFWCCGAAAGLFAGLAAGLLTAPSSGERTRRRLRRAGEELQDRVAETAEEWGDRIRDKAGRGSALLEEARRKAAAAR